MIGRARRFFALPRNERFATAEAIATLTIVFLVLKTLPFAAAMRVFRLRAGDDLAPFPIDATRARIVARAVGRAARNLPFRAVCLPQAAAAAMMLRRRGLPAEVRFGVAKRDGEVTAHAWSRSGTVPVTGMEGAGEFIQVARYAI